MTNQLDVTTIGETMLRLSVPAGQRLETAAVLDAFPAGTEANVMVALARLGRRVGWAGGLPTNPLGRLVANHLRMAGVDLGGVIWREGRLGTYFIEFATKPRATQVIYDRADSVAANLGPEDAQWDYLLNTRLVHLTGITPALSPKCLALTEAVIQRAKAAHIPISFDINYRNKLWSFDQARAILLPLIQEVDLLFCGQADAAGVFQCHGSREATVQQLAEMSHARTVIVTFSDQGVIAWDGNQFHHEPAFPVEMVDRIGAGDAFAAGVIHGWLSGNLVQGLRYGVALAAIKLTQHGDMVVTTEEELLSVLENAGGGVNR